MGITINKDFTIEDRAKFLRKNILNITQEKFAEKINLKRNTIAIFETNKQNISDRTILDICREFKVNENWLRNGIEPIFVETDDTLLNKVINEYNIKDEAIIKVMENFLAMPNEDKLDLIEKANTLLASTSYSTSKNNVAEQLTIPYMQLSEPSKKEVEAYAKTLLLNEQFEENNSIAIKKPEDNSNKNADSQQQA